VVDVSWNPPQSESWVFESFESKSDRRRVDSLPSSLDTGETAAFSPILDTASKYNFPAKAIAGKNKQIHVESFGQLTAEPACVCVCVCVCIPKADNQY